MSDIAKNETMTLTEWFGCYSETWNGTLVPEAYSHPAKVTAGLARRIYEHMIAQGYVKPGQHIVDPFGGVAGFAYHAMLNGLHWHGIELENRFIAMGSGLDCIGFSKADWRRYHGRSQAIRGDVCPACRNAINAKPKPLKAGHGRQADLFSRASRAIPCAAAHHYTGNIERWQQNPLCTGTAVLTQGDSRELARLLGAADAVATSPPFGETQTGGGLASPGARHNDGHKFGNNHGYQQQGTTPGQLGAMSSGDFAAALTSPPYGDAVNHEQLNGIDWEMAGRPDRLQPSAKRNNPMTSNMMSYGRTPGNLGNLRYDGAVTSPPFEESSPHNGGAAQFITDKRLFGSYGSTPGNIGNDTGDTFWTAARLILEQLMVVLKPGGVAVFVTGDFVRGGKRVLFGQQWLELCTAVGFEPLEWIIAHKREVKGTQLDIFGGEVVRTVDRVSFFRRLANEGNPDASITNEDVIFVRKPGGN